MQTKIDLDQIVDEMKSLGEMLMPYNWPHGHPALENDIAILKTRELEVDGYAIAVYFNRSNYGSYFVETLQIYGEKFCFLPFCLVAKLGKKFLGDHELYLTELIRHNRKIYLWTVSLDLEGKPIPPRFEIQAENCVYDGFKYNYMKNTQLKLH